MEAKKRKSDEGNETNPTLEKIGVKCDDDISALFCNEKFSDVIFVINESKIYAHKAILAKKSPYFEKMLFGVYSEASKNEILLNNVSEDLFKEVLNFIYCGRFTENRDRDLEVLDLAEQYLMNDLKTLIADRLMDAINVGNVFQILKQAELYNLPNLSAACFSFLDEKVRELVGSEAFLEQSSETLKKIFGRPTLFLPDIDIFKAIVKWCETNSKTCDDFFDVIPLSNMTVEEIVTVIRPTKLFADNILMNVIAEMYNNRSTSLKMANYEDSAGECEVFCNIKFNLSENTSDSHYASYVENSKRGIIFKFKEQKEINTIELKLHTDTEKHTYRYCIETSIDRCTWQLIIDYRKYDCRGEQKLYFAQHKVQYVRVSGKSVCNKDLAIVFFKARTDTPTQEKNGICCPNDWVGKLFQTGFVLEGYETQDRLSSGSDDCIIFQLNQPYIINTVKFKLSGRTYTNIIIETSLDNVVWTTLIPKRIEERNDEKEPQIFQYIIFDERPIVYLKISDEKTIKLKRYTSRYITEPYTSRNFIEFKYTSR